MFCTAICLVPFWLLKQQNCFTFVWLIRSVLVGSVSVLKCFAIAGLPGLDVEKCTQIFCTCWFNTGLVNAN